MYSVNVFSRVLSNYFSLQNYVFWLYVCLNKSTLRVIVKPVCFLRFSNLNWDKNILRICHGDFHPKVKNLHAEAKKHYSYSSQFSLLQCCYTFSRLGIWYFLIYTFFSTKSNYLLVKLFKWLETARINKLLQSLT